MDAGKSSTTTIISAKSTVDDNSTPVRSKKRNKRTIITSADTNGAMENGNVSTSSPTINSDSRNNQTESDSPNLDRTRKFNEYEVTSVADEDDDEDERDRHVVSQSLSQSMTDRDNTMVSSFTTGGDNDVIEIHQFSSADIDAYLDIYFETLNTRLRRYIGENEELQHFRTAMKTRINSNPNASEYQNVLLGKINGEVLAAVTMLFPKETPTIPQTSDGQPRSSCLTPVHRWMVRKANYVPSNIEECYIEMIGVKNTYRNHGVGSAMLECVEHLARQAGANILTVHINGKQTRSFFQRFGFTMDNTDSSPFWKWLVERQTITKLSKVLTSDGENNDHITNSYLNESMTENADDE
ncbi:unnamed protein product [Rotaria magnacalcarata]|uniref:N-acetyltransferase domain-containing protein n=1 Tax=Rotaria magnacalcarata TaxID=392030 RepID=A0A816V3K5_9BILA|nr:unnamed protein product [Rotaria magnacalcarata]CAF2117870.1 unnamed protein product [Rotaria magnacalcarata]CAF3895106.1 unnamed protein product [Rotaria magnacalcarata]CAF4005470.1 unnamed protein product [Rotaria magnacalcarata]